jgi:hypothetical protein
MSWCCSSKAMVECERVLALQYYSGWAPPRRRRSVVGRRTVRSLLLALAHSHSKRVSLLLRPSLVRRCYVPLM